MGAGLDFAGLRGHKLRSLILFRIRILFHFPGTCSERITQHDPKDRQFVSTRLRAHHTSQPKGLHVKRSTIRGHFRFRHVSFGRLRSPLPLLSHDADRHSSPSPLSHSLIPFIPTPSLIPTTKIPVRRFLRLSRLKSPNPSAFPVIPHLFRSLSSMSSASSRRFSIGYALAPKKQQSFIQPSLVNLARDRAIDLIPIDSSRRLIDQGPFDCVIHKLSGPDWKDQLNRYTSANPNVPIIDPLDAIERLHNRISMLQVVSELEIPRSAAAPATFGVPKQIVIFDSGTLSDPAASNGLKFPVIAKPLVADGSARSHKMSLVFNRDGLTRLKPPVVLQEFINHGGVIFKVYVVGDHVRCVKRRSLPDVTEENLDRSEVSVSFSQVSNMTMQDRSDDNYLEAMHLEEVEMPPLSFVAEIARGLRRAMKLHLFNFDVIRDVKVGNRYLIIDINYFPGYAKMPSYEIVLTDFFCEIVNKEQIEGASSAPGETESPE